MFGKYIHNINVNKYVSQTTMFKKFFKFKIKVVKNYFKT